MRELIEANEDAGPDTLLHTGFPNFKSLNAPLRETKGEQKGEWKPMKRYVHPRVPLAGEVNNRLTPRAPKSGQEASSGRGSSSRSTPSAYRGGSGRVFEINISQMGSLERDKMLYLAKKLVHLSILLEQDTVTDDFKYPSFYAPPSQIALPRT